MNKTEMIVKIAENAGLTKKQAEDALKAVTDAITEALAAGEKVQLVGFGSFEAHTRAAHTGRDPKTNEALEIPAKTVPVFKAGKALKDAVAK